MAEKCAVEGTPVQRYRRIVYPFEQLTVSFSFKKD